MLCFHSLSRKTSHLMIKVALYIYLQVIHYKSYVKFFYKFLRIRVNMQKPVLCKIEDQLHFNLGKLKIVQRVEITI